MYNLGCLLTKLFQNTFPQSFPRLVCSIQGRVCPFDAFCLSSNLLRTPSRFFSPPFSRSQSPAWTMREKVFEFPANPKKLPAHLAVFRERLRLVFVYRAIFRILIIFGCTFSNYFLYENFVNSHELKTGKCKEKINSKIYRNCTYMKVIYRAKLNSRVQTVWL